MHAGKTSVRDVRHKETRSVGHAEKIDALGYREAHSSGLSRAPGHEASGLCRTLVSPRKNTDVSTRSLAGDAGVLSLASLCGRPVRRAAAAVVAPAHFTPAAGWHKSSTPASPVGHFDSAPASRSGSASSVPSRPASGSPPAPVPTASRPAPPAPGRLSVSPSPRDRRARPACRASGRDRRADRAGRYNTPRTPPLGLLVPWIIGLALPVGESRRFATHRHARRSDYLGIDPGRETLGIGVITRTGD